MKPIPTYETVEPKGTSDFVALKLGGHVCIIKNAYEIETTTCKRALALELDIAGGDQKDYFKKMYENDTRLDIKWPCIYRQLIENEENVAYFKGMITAIEKSNTEYTWDWDEKKLIGKMVGGVFGLEEYVAQDGITKTATKCVRLRSTDKVNETPIPKVKLLDGSTIEYEEYSSKKVGSISANSDNTVKQFITNNLTL